MSAFLLPWALFLLAAIAVIALALTADALATRVRSRGVAPIQRPWRRRAARRALEAVRVPDTAAALGPAPYADLTSRLTAATQGDHDD